MLRCTGLVPGTSKKSEGNAKMKTLITIALVASALAAGAKTSTPAGWTDDYDAALKQAGEDADDSDQGDE